MVLQLLSNETFDKPLRLDDKMDNEVLGIFEDKHPLKTGPLGVDAAGWRQLCCSFGHTLQDLCEYVAAQLLDIRALA